MKPTQEEVCDALAMINLLAINCAMRGAYTQNHPNLMKLIDWLEDEFGIEKEVDHEEMPPVPGK
jgi:hypothetical protein